MSLLLAVTMVLAGCSDAEDRLDATVRSFAEALSRGDADAAADLTSDPAAASATLGELFASLGSDVTFRPDRVRAVDSEGGFALGATWTFGPDDAHEWTYTTDGEATADGQEWKIRWDPAVVAPGLDAGPLAYSTLVPQPASRYAPTARVSPESASECPK